MADEQHVQAEAQKVIDAVLNTGDHTEGGAAVDEAVAAKAQELYTDANPVDKIGTVPTPVSEPQSVSPLEDEPEETGLGPAQGAPEPTPATVETLPDVGADPVVEPVGSVAGASPATGGTAAVAEVPAPVEDPIPVDPPAFAGENTAAAPVSVDEVHEAPALPVEPAAEEPEAKPAAGEPAVAEPAVVPEAEEQPAPEPEVAAPAVEPATEAPVVEEPKPDAVQVAPEPAGTKRLAEEVAVEGEAPEAKAAKFEIDPEDPNAAYFNIILEIPPGQTRTFSEIATAAGAKTTAARSIGRTVAKIANDETSGLPWWRVVSSVGALQSNPARQEAQLERLRAEGARPNEGEGITEWAARVGAKVVGTYALGSLRTVFADYDNDDVTTFNPHSVEPFESREAATVRGFSRL